MLPRAGRFAWPLDIGYARPPFASLAAGANQLVAGTNGVALGRFGWVDPESGEVSNVYTAGFLMGFVLAVYDQWNWQRAYPSPPSYLNLNESGYPTDPFVNTDTFTALVLRAGQQCIVSGSGEFYTPFPLGAQVGTQVYANPQNGDAWSGNPGGGIATPFTVMQSGGANTRLRISSFVPPLGT